MRAATYARFSSELQHESSIEDQVRNCQRFAERHSWQIVARYDDRAISGAKSNRPGYQAMLAAAQRHEFDVLLVDDLSRLSRDEIEFKQTIRRFTFSGLRIVGVSDGFDTESKGHKIQATFRGLINEIYLDDLSEKTHRGLTGKALAGLNTGGRSYGYRHVPIRDGTDEYGHPRAVAARREIDPAQAKVVREIFEMFASGLSPRNIAHELNHRGVPSPRDGTWAVSAIYADKKRPGVGILGNPLYIGRVLWNRTRWGRDPDTGKRKRKERPASEWIGHDDESLRIIPQELWEAAQRRISTPTTRGGSQGKARPRTLLGGLLRCGGCGGAVVAVSSHSYGCAAKHDRGRAVCEGVFVPRTRADRELLAVLRENLLSPLRLSQLQAEVRNVLRENHAAEHEAQSEARRRLAQVETEITNIVAAIKAGAWSQLLQSELTRLEAERDQLRVIKTLTAQDSVEEIPGLLERYHKLLDRLNDNLAQRPEQARMAVAEALGEIVLVREGKAVFAEFDDPAYRLLIAAGKGVYPSGSGGRI